MTKIVDEDNKHYKEFIRKWVKMQKDMGLNEDKEKKGKRRR